MEVFKDQMRTGTLTVTDPEMTRFYVTLPQAVSFVQEVLSIMEGGEVFVPKLPAWTLKQLVAIFHPSQVWIIGYREGGEKAHEQLVSDEEERRVIDLDRFYVVLPDPHEWTMAYKWDHVERTELHYYASNNTLQVSPEVLTEAIYGH